jgi:hypothetical protein
MSFLLLHAGRGPDIYIAVGAAYFHVFFPELVLELLSSALCKSGLKTKESIKAQNKRYPLKIFFFKQMNASTSNLQKNSSKARGKKNKLWIQKN